jgi:uncharacterized protein
MNSSLYECQILHERFTPRRHRFLYRIFYFAIDLDELGELHRKLPFFSCNRANLYSFRDGDYFPTGEKSHLASGENDSAQTEPLAGLKERVVAYLADHKVDLTEGRVVLVTLPRVLGYLFNPVSFYFCYDRHGVPVAAISEVTNTFKEMKPYLLGPERKASASASGEFHLRIPKFFYVSPYSDVDVAFDFTLRPLGKKLSIQIDDYTGAERTLTSVLSGTQRELTSARLVWYLLKYPLITLQVIALIHWHALLLWIKRVPWFAKGRRAGDQRGLYRPHISIVPAQPPTLP